MYKKEKWFDDFIKKTRDKRYIKVLNNVFLFSLFTFISEKRKKGKNVILDITYVLFPKSNINNIKKFNDIILAANVEIFWLIHLVKYVLKIKKNIKHT